MAKIGYARVSSRSQNLDRQLTILRNMSRAVLNCHFMAV